MKIKTLALVAGVALLLQSAGSMAMNSAELYKVKEGESLQSISSRAYGCTTEWVSIYEANRDSINNPNMIYPNQVIRLPELGEYKAVLTPMYDDELSFPENPWDFN